MSFLAPFFLLGGLAIALPLVFHLVRRASRERVLFSSLMFLKPTPPRMTRRSRFEHIVLLLMRCLALLILAAGFARPFLQRPMTPAAAGVSGSQIVILVDASASMRRAGLWEDAIKQADAILQKTTAADQVALMVFDNQVRTVIGFEQWTALNSSERTGVAAQRLAELKPSWRATHLGNALIAAGDLIEDAEKREPHTGPRRVVLISDLQEGSRRDELQGHEWPRGLEVVVQTVKARRTTNAGLQWVLDTDDTARTTGETPMRLRIQNSADAQREQFQLRWVGVVGARSLDAYVPPGQSRVLSAPALPAGNTGVRLSLSGDDDDFDNSVFVVQPKAEEISVRYLGDDAETNPAQGLYYLKRAFQDTRRQAVKVMGNTQGPEDPKTQPAAVTNISSVASRLMVGPANFPAAYQAEVRAFLTNGGTALLVMNDADTAALGELLGTTGLRASEASVGNYAMLAELDLTHPLLSPFADPRFGDFTKVRFWKHRKLVLEGVTNARVIARFDDRDPAIVELPVGRGRLFLFTFSWRPVDSQLALSSKFVPLLYSLLDQAGGAPTQIAQYHVGDPVDLAAYVPQPGSGSMLVRTPGGAEVRLAAGETRFTQTEEPGRYEAVVGNVAVPFAVNLDPVESRTAPVSVDELERLGLPMKPATAAPAMSAVAQQNLRNTELESRQKMWRWLIVAALVVLVLETWLAGRITRRSTLPMEAAT